MFCSEVFLTTLITSQLATFSPQDKYKEAVGIEASQLEPTRKYINERVPGFAAVIHGGKLFIIKLRDRK